MADLLIQPCKRCKRYNEKKNVLIKIINVDIMGPIIQ